MKRFYKQAAVGPIDDAGFAVVLDGRPVRTPGRAFLRLPSEALAAAIAEEWQAQKETIEPARMPLTQLASTALDRVMPNPASVGAEIAKFAETDLVCYFADGPDGLIARQRTVWAPLLQWLAADVGAHLATTGGIRPIRQDAAAIAAVQAAVAELEAFPLAALSTATAASGSVVIGLALVRGRIDGNAAADAAEIDERYQMEQWGADAEAERRLAQLRSDFVAVERFLSLL